MDNLVYYVGQIKLETGGSEYGTTWKLNRKSLIFVFGHRFSVDYYTVGARIPNIRIPNTFKNGTIWKLVIEWLYHLKIEPFYHSKTKLLQMGTLA